MTRITDETMQPFEKEHIAAVRALAAECTLLLKSDGTLPLAAPCRLALYGSGARKTIKGGTGSGDVNVRHFTTIEEGLKNAGFEIASTAWLDRYDALMADEHKKFVEQVKKEAKELGVNPVMYGMGKAMAEPEYEFPLDFGADMAVYVLSRISGEGADRSGVAGDIDLSETEIRDILALNGGYEHFVLVLNVGGMVNLAPVAEVKNILLLGQLGTPTGDVLADLLLGKSYPSGKLAMTWAPIAEYASTEGFGDMDDTRYREGIYVGYRYFDSAGKAPTFPFGYGLSYTEFSVEPEQMEADAEKIELTVMVKNVGKHAGREVVQAYYSAPKGRLGKPYQELAAFEKTGELAPGEEQRVTLSFETASMASYDEKAAAYVLEKGNYRIRVGNSSRSTKVCGTVALDQDAVARRVKNICHGCDFTDWIPGGVAQDEGEAGGDMPMLSIHAADIGTEEIHYCSEPSELPDKGNCSFEDVISGTGTVEDFVACLTEEQLAYLSIGLFDENGGMGSIVGAAAVTVAGAAGETTQQLAGLGVPTLVMADGPAGLRLCTQYKIVDGRVKGMDNSLSNFMEFMEPEQLQQLAAMAGQPGEEELAAPVNYTYCTAIPVGTALAQSFNPEAARKCGDLVGREMELFGIHLWLAPAMNIQRSPLCGRDFEYFSEDPVVSGLMAAAVTEGVQSHRGCGVTVKHFACNNQETNRMVSNSIVSERALREIYLRTFEICVKKAKPAAIMSSYNLVNGEHTCNSRDLLTGVLRDEWGYSGVVMTDWYAADSVMTATSERKNKYAAGSAAGCVKAGNDLTMPGMADDKKEIMGALVDAGCAYPITRADLQVTAGRVLETILKLTRKEDNEIYG